MKLDLQEGWDWMIHEQAAYRSDTTEFDFYTGELTFVGSDSGTGLSLQSTDVLNDEDEFQAVLDEVADAKCERYVDPFGSDPLSSQGHEIRLLLWSSVSAAMADQWTDEYVAANSAANEWVYQNGPSLDDYELQSDEWYEARNERDVLKDEWFSAEYPDLVETHDSIGALSRELNIASRTSTMVREAQEFFIDVCDLTVSDSYEYPSPVDLEIEVGEEYVRSLDR